MSVSVVRLLCCPISELTRVDLDPLAALVNKPLLLLICEHVEIHLRGSHDKLQSSMRALRQRRNNDRLLTRSVFNGGRPNVSKNLSMILELPFMTSKPPSRGPLSFKFMMPWTQKNLRRCGDWSMCCHDESSVGGAVKAAREGTMSMETYRKGCWQRNSRTPGIISEPPEAMTGLSSVRENSEQPNKVERPLHTIKRDD